MGTAKRTARGRTPAAVGPGKLLDGLVLSLDPGEDKARLAAQLVATDRPPLAPLRLPPAPTATLLHGRAASAVFDLRRVRVSVDRDSHVLLRVRVGPASCRRAGRGLDSRLIPARAASSVRRVARSAVMGRLDCPPSAPARPRRQERVLPFGTGAAGVSHPALGQNRVSPGSNPCPPQGTHTSEQGKAVGSPVPPPSPALPSRATLDAVTGFPPRRAGCLSLVPSSGASGCCISAA